MTGCIQGHNVTKPVELRSDKFSHLKDYPDFKHFLDEMLDSSDKVCSK